MEKLDDMIIGESKNKNVKRIFKEKPVMCFDNYFSHDNTSDLVGKKWYGLLYTVRRDCLPKGLPAQYMCKEGTENHSQLAKCARFNYPIVMAKKMTDKETGNIYQKVHVIFQSTSSCNIQAVNMLSKVSLFKDIKERGMG
eukprot:555814-Ditylum_brightwellii.AAC.1